jgi:hypothetical protein
MNHGASLISLFPFFVVIQRARHVLVKPQQLAKVATIALPFRVIIPAYVMTPTMLLMQTPVYPAYARYAHLVLQAAENVQAEETPSVRAVSLVFSRITKKINN